jgi:uncharacterized protein with GYD domain
MQTFFMFGKYSSDSLKGISQDRTKQTKALIEKHGGKLKDIYVMLGQYDLVLIVELPSVEEAMKVSVLLNKLSDICFSTSPALPVEKFDQITNGL